MLLRRQGAGGNRFPRIVGVKGSLFVYRGGIVATPEEHRRAVEEEARAGFEGGGHRRQRGGRDTAE